MKNLIKDLPLSDRPRERLKEVGVENLSNEELISIILKTGTKDTSVKILSNKILKEINSIKDLKNISINKLTNIKGVGEVKALSLIASLELGKRVYLTKLEKDKLKIKNSKIVYEYYKNKFLYAKQEMFCVMFLDTKKNLIEEKMIFLGTLNASSVHAREIFKEAIKYSSAAIICVHNHPSGDSTPSLKDIETTTKLKQIGKLIGIEVIDHIIIGNNNYYSFYE